MRLEQGCTDAGHQVTRQNEFCTIAPKICDFSVWRSLHGTLRYLEFGGGSYSYFKQIVDPGLEDDYKQRGDKVPPPRKADRGLLEGIIKQLVLVTEVNNETSLLG